MDIDRTRRVGSIALAGGCAAVAGAFWPSDLVFLLAAAATATLSWAAWQLGRGIHQTRDALREAGGTIATIGLALATVGFAAAFVGAVRERPEWVFAALSSAVSTGLYVVVPVGLVLLGIRALRWETLSGVGRALPLVIGLGGVVAIPATVLISLPGFTPGRFATMLGLVREIVLIGWIPIGISLRRACAPQER
jgi:hypothetical protein